MLKLVPVNKKSNTGAVRILIFAYGVLAFAAIGRSSFELATKFDKAPVPYALSAVAAVFYVLATISLVKKGKFFNRLATWILSFELLFVVTVGLVTTVDESLFPAHTVWSNFGASYGFTPLALPIIGLVWLSRERKK